MEQSSATQRLEPGLSCGLKGHIFLLRWGEERLDVVGIEFENQSACKFQIHTHVGLLFETFVSLKKANSSSMY